MIAKLLELPTKRLLKTLKSTSVTSSSSKTTTSSTKGEEVFIFFTFLLGSKIKIQLSISEMLFETFNILSKTFFSIEVFTNSEFTHKFKSLSTI